MVEVETRIHQAMRQAGVVWLAATGAATAAWVLWRDGAAYLVTGPGEQPAPGVAEAGTVLVTVAESGGRVLTWRASVSRLAPHGAEWREVCPALVARRLNLPDSDPTADRWAAECAMLRLAPTGELVDS